METSSDQGFEEFGVLTSITITLNPKPRELIDVLQMDLPFVPVASTCLCLRCGHLLPTFVIIHVAPSTAEVYS